MTKEWVFGQRIWGPKGQGLEQALTLQVGLYSDLLPDWHVDQWNREAPLSFHKFQQFINSLQKNCNR